MRPAQRRKGPGTRDSSTVGMWEGSTSTANDDRRPDAIAGAYQARGPIGLAGISQPMKLSPSRCSRHAVGVTVSRPSCSSSPRIDEAASRVSQLGPRWGLQGPDLGRPRRQPPRTTTLPCRQRATPPPRSLPATTAGSPYHCLAEHHCSQHPSPDDQGHQVAPLPSLVVGRRRAPDPQRQRATPPGAHAAP